MRTTISQTITSSRTMMRHPPTRPMPRTSSSSRCRSYRNQASPIVDISWQTSLLDL